MIRFRQRYGARPVHLVAVVASFTLVTIGFFGWLHPGSDPGDILAWLIGSAIAFELVLLPLAWLLDRFAFGLVSMPGGAPVRGAGKAYVRVPGLLSGLLLLVFFPLIFRLGNSTFIAFNGIAPSGYLIRWLFATAVVFFISALVHGIQVERAALGVSSQPPSRAPAPAPSREPAMAQAPYQDPPRSRFRRWLLTPAVMLCCSALLYTIKWIRARSRWPR